jgi:nitrogen fixation/metabolism regulation signal transduction histidine kinase
VRQIDPREIRLQVENLKISHPEILEDDEAWLATLESETDFNEILTTIVRRIEDTKALVIGTKDRFEELESRKKRFEHRVETLRNLAFRIMQAADLAKVELPEATLSLRAGTQQIVGEADPATLPDTLCNISRNPNRTAIKDALKTGVTVPGYSLSNSPPSLSIRIK